MILKIYHIYIYNIYQTLCVTFTSIDLNKIYLKFINFHNTHNNACVKINKICRHTHCKLIGNIVSFYRQDLLLLCIHNSNLHTKFNCNFVHSMQLFGVWFDCCSAARILNCRRNYCHASIMCNEHNLVQFVASYIITK